MVPISDVPDVIANYHLCVVKTMRLDSNCISRANQMKLIMQFGVGLEGHCLICSFAINLELFGYDLYFWMYFPFMFHNICC